MISKKVFGIVFVMIFGFIMNTIAQDGDKFVVSQQNTEMIDDLPHVFWNDKGQIQIYKLVNGKLTEHTDDIEQTLIQYLGFNPLLHVDFFQSKDYYANAEFSQIDDFLVISDIHGQYELFLKFLKSHGVVDNELNWNFGDKHLIVLGDIMGRGPQVSEALWLTYKLEMQALQQGGRVHYFSGNHELMVMDHDFRYLNDKYVNVAQNMGLSPNDLYSNHTLLGKWLSKRPVMLKINDVLLVHAGVSQELLRANLSINSINTLFNSTIYHQEKEWYRKNDLLNLLARTNGPLWFRGYFSDEPLATSIFEKSLEFYGVNKIIVGHTSFSEIQYLYDGKLFGVDGNIKGGKNGQVLIFEKGKYFRGTQEGERIPIE